MAEEVLRLRILDAMVECLAEITPSNGYAFDLSETEVIYPGTPEQMLVRKQVVYGRMVFGDDAPLPMVSILEVPIPLDQIPPPPDSTYSNGGWELLIQGFVPDDLFRPTRPAHKLMAAVKKRLALEKRKNRDYNILGMGKHVTDMRIGAGVVRPPDEVSSKAYFWLNLTLDVVEDLADPFED